ncbi:MAG TPA: YqeG family HAD IIIA-type phosphatase [Candidatus Enterocloster faecavium]|uniref:YqeG family HAD IIIA-type phosphatase n=1 Tax=Candidatus Enterocloster faecavium TaxID=2838560 RepID=A0A9D2RL02_9FIRM|nr:YqeG family HAD IIIA-type phosphatase [Candidatus Enterocloster faecavium]
MLERFYPAERADSVYGIPYEKYRDEGYRGIIFDIDNTLVPHGAPADERAEALFERLRRLGFATCLLSNNKEPRVKSFAGQVKSSYIFKGGKPSPGGYIRAMEKMGTEVGNTLFVGDQLFTDIYGANRAGVKSILVNPIHPREEIQIVLKRFLERPVLAAYERSRNRKIKR